MKGHLSQDTPVDVPAAAVWDVYGGLELGRLVNKLLPDLFGRIEVVEGDGGVGTLIKITFPPGSDDVSGCGYMIEKYTKIDDENRVKETEIIEGEYKVLGFDFFGFRLEIVEKDAESSVVRTSIVYEIDDKLAHFAANVSLEPLHKMAETIGRYLLEKKTAD